MKLFLIIVVFSVGQLFCQDKDRNSGPISANVFESVQERILKQTALSYSSSFKQKVPGRDDSLLAVDGQVWLVPDPADTIFGYRFHLKGSDEQGEFDYYYDGQNCYEIRHPQKQVLVFDPYQFPNDQHNPAKARVALLPVVSLLTDTDIKKSLLEGNPDQAMIDSGGIWKLEFRYPKDENGQITTRYLSVREKDSQIVADETHTVWGAIQFSAKRAIKDVLTNDPEIRNHVNISSSFSDYTTRYVPETVIDSTDDGFTGKTAPAFSYPSFGGKEIRLSDYRGKYVLLDFWESWCGICILAIPDMKRLHDQFGSKGLALIGIVTENKKEVDKIIRANELNHPTLFADESVLKEYDVRGRPLYVLIDPAGKIVKRFYGNHRRLTAVLESKLK